MLKTMTELNGVSGQEDAVRTRIRQELTPYCTEMCTDNMGNLIVYKKGRSGGKHILLSSHMDEVGFLVTDITEDGYLKFDTVGGIDPSVLVSKRVRVNDCNGVISFKAIHLTTREEREKPVKLSSLCIDIGADSRAEAEKHVMVGDYCFFDSDYVEYGQHKVKAKAIDDRAGCCILMELCKQEWDCDLTLLFTTQEEVGLRGAKTAVYGVQPDYAIVVEATTCNDLTGVDDAHCVTRQGKGGAISVLDSASCADAELLNLLVDAAEKCGASYQFKASTRGGNDAGSLSIANGGIKTCSLSIPCRYIHSPVCVMDKRDYQSCVQILTRFLQDMAVPKAEYAVADIIPCTYVNPWITEYSGLLGAEALCGWLAPSGREYALSGYLCEKLKPFADEVRVDPMNNVIARWKGTGKKILLECGIDEYGLMVTDASDPKKVRVAAVGRPNPETLPGQKVRFFGGAVGIVRTEKTQDSDADQKEKKRKFDDLYVELESGETNTGDFAAVFPNVWVGADEISAANLYARMPSFCLLQMLAREKRPECDLTLLLSAQMNLGARGARAAIGQLEPDIILFLDTCSAEEEEKGKLGIMVKERNAVAEPELRGKMTDVARAHGIPVRMVLETETHYAEQISLCGKGAVFGGLYLPLVGKGTMRERMAKKVVENTQNLLLQLLPQL